MSSSVHFNLYSVQEKNKYDLFGENEKKKNTHKTYQKTQMKRTFSLVPERFDSIRNVGVSNQKGIVFCEILLKSLVLILLILTFPFSLVVSLRVIAQYQRAVLFRLGRLVSKESLGPGLIFVIPCLDTMKRIDLRTLTFDVPTQEVLTKDSVTVAVEAVVYYRIFDPVMSVVNVENANRSTRLLAQTTLRNVLGTVDLCSLLTDREDIAASMQEALDMATDAWGMKVERVEIKDVRLPTQLQRAMAAEAEATREAKAKVIASEGERNSAKALREAAEEITKCPIAIQLRYLQTLSSISMEKNSTIIFPLPIDCMNFYKNSCQKKPTKSSMDIFENTFIQVPSENHNQIITENDIHNNESEFTV